MIYVRVGFVKESFYVFFSAENHLACKFQTGLCNWKQAEDDIFNWTRRFGETLSPDTGPSTGYGGTGTFLTAVIKMNKLCCKLKLDGKSTTQLRQLN